MAFLLLNILAQRAGEQLLTDHGRALRRVQSIRWIAQMDGTDSHFQNAEIPDLLNFRGGHLQREIMRIWRDARLQLRLIPVERVVNSWMELPWGMLSDFVHRETDRANGRRDEGAKKDEHWAATHQHTQRPGADPELGSANLGTILAAKSNQADRQVGVGLLLASKATGRGQGRHKTRPEPRPEPDHVPPVPPAKAVATVMPWPASQTDYATVRGHAAPARGAAEGSPRAKKMPKHAAPAASAHPSAPLSATNVDRERPEGPEVEPAAGEAADAGLSATPPSPEAAGAPEDEFTGTLEDMPPDWTWGPDPQQGANPEPEENPVEKNDPVPAEARLSHTAARPSHRASACLSNYLINYIIN